jgi:hypothetical protein
MNIEALAIFPTGGAQSIDERFLSDSNEQPEHTECDIVEFRLGNRNRDSLSENYILEIDAWARQAMASNGFGDY